MKPYPDADEIYKNIGRRIREERIKRSWTQEFLAERAGLHLSFVGQVERGLKKPSLRTLKILALVFEIKAGELLDESSRRAPAYPLEKKFFNLIRDLPHKQQGILYQTIRQLSRQARRLSGKRPD